MSVLLLGAKGQLGVELNKLLYKFGNVVALTRNELDLTNLKLLEDYLYKIKPKIIVNASAYTSVDKAETEKDLAMQINESVPETLSQHALKNNAILIHYSTDYVFDGKKTSPYLETDYPNPLSTYGFSKYMGEQRIINSKCNHLIFRTGWLFSAHGQNFLTTILKLAQKKEELHVVNDQWGSPTSCEWLAQATIIALQQCLQNQSEKNVWGVYHASGEDLMTWYSYAEYILKNINLTKLRNLKLQPSGLYPIKSNEYPQAASRPIYSVLNNQKLINTFSVQTHKSHLKILNELQKIGSNYEFENQLFSFDNSKNLG